MYEESHRNTGNSTHNSSEIEPEPSLDEVRWAIKNLKRGKSPGCDNITAEMIQSGGEITITIYHTLHQDLEIRWCIVYKWCIV